MKNKNMARVRASLALMALCGFSTFGVSPVMAEELTIKSVTSGNENTLTVSTNSSGVVTITPVTGDISETSNALVTGKTMYLALRYTQLDLGYNNTVSVSDGYAFGALNTVEGEAAAAVGYYNYASEDYSYALGFENWATAQGASAFGYYNTASGDYASAVGVSNTASGNASSALGYVNKASGEYSSAVGFNNLASGEDASALGYGNTASGTASTAVGVESIAAGEKSTAMGYGSYAGAEGATAIGYQAVSTETGTVSFGHKKDDATGTYTVTYQYEKDGTKVTETTTTTKEYNVGDELSRGKEVTACEADTYDSDSFARLTNVAAGDSTNEAAVWDQIAAKVNTSNTVNQVNLSTSARTGTKLGNNNEIVANDGTVLARFTASTTGTVKASGTTQDNGFVSGDVLYDYTMPVASGTQSTTTGVTGTLNYVSTGNSVGTNLGILDSKIGKITTSNIVSQNNTISKNLELLATAISGGDYCVVDTGSTMDQAYKTYRWLSTDFGSTNVTHGDNSTAYGYKANATNYGGVAIGYNAQAIGNSGVAIGKDSYIGLVLNATVIGADATAANHGWGNVAVGAGAVASNNSFAGGYKAQTYSINAVAVGAETYAYSNSVAVGMLAENHADNTVSLGVRASVGGKNSVALGSNSVANEENTISVGHAKGDEYYIYSATTQDSTKPATKPNVFTYGDTLTRRIINVADGKSSTDAATYGQLVNANVDSNDSTKYTAYEADSDGIVTVKTNNGGTAFKIKMSAADASYDIQSGNENMLSVSKENNVVTVTPVTGDISQSNQKLVTGGTVYTELHSNNLNLGYRNTITDGKTYQTAVGSLNKIGDSADTAVGFYNKAKGGNSSAVGDENTAEGVAASAMGSTNTASGKRSNAFGFANSTSKDYDSAMGAGNTASGSYSSAVGVLNTASGAASSALGYYNTASGKLSTAVGALSAATGNGSVAMGYYSYAGAQGATAIGYQAVSTEAGTVSFGHKSGEFTGYYKDSSGNMSTTQETGYEAVNYDSDSFARLTNVADGTDNHDAATYGQLVKNQEYTFDSSTGIATIETNAGKTAFTLKLSSNGSVAEKDSGLISGAKVYAEVRPTKDGNYIKKDVTTADNLKELDVAIGPKLKENGNYIKKDNSVTANLSELDSAVKNSYVDGGSYTISANQRTVTVKNKDNSDAFTLTVEASAGGVYTSGDHINIDNDYKISVKTDGEVASGNTGIVTGGAVYEAITDKTGDTSKLKEAGLSDNLADSILDVNEKVDNVANQVVDVMNNGMSSLRNDINKVGAGAAALAALRPEGYDPDDKFSFAIGYGHYKNANAGAIGAFYKPNQDTTVSFGSTIGNGDPMMNIGFSFKLGARSKGASIYSSNVELVREMNSIRKDNEMLRKVNSDQAKEIDALKADNAQMKAQIAQILKKLELSDTVKKTVTAH